MLIENNRRCRKCQIQQKRRSYREDQQQRRQKNKYRDHNYDRMELAVPKGMKARIKEIAKEQGYSSQNNYVVEAVKEKYLRDTGEELTWQ